MITAHRQCRPQRCGYARGGNYLLVNGDLVRTSNFDDARAEALQASANDPVTLRYSYDDGITLTGNTKFHKDRIGHTRGTTKIYTNRPIGLVPSERGFSFEWSWRQQVWYVPKSRRTLYNRAAIDEIAGALSIGAFEGTSSRLRGTRSPMAIAWVFGAPNLAGAPAER